MADSPANSGCNPYTAYWGDGSASGCANGWRRNAWCADFAAWAWRQAGVSFTYGFAGSDINAWSASFYFWGLATGNWHPLSSGYQPQPGDGAVYGNLSEASGPGHVGIYVGGPASSPTVVNGNWAVNWPSPRNYGVIEQSNESSTGVAGGGLDGYVSPPNRPGGGPRPGGSVGRPLAIRSITVLPNPSGNPNPGAYSAYAVGSDGRAYTSWQNSVGSAWTAWQPFGQSQPVGLSGSITVLPNPSGNPNPGAYSAYAVGSDGRA